MFDERFPQADNLTFEIEISDIKASTLKKLIQCIYHGNIEQLRLHTAYELYTAADKYDFHAVKHICTQYVIENVSLYGALEFADRIRDAGLLNSLINDAAKNSVILHSHDFKVFSDYYPRLAIKIYRAFFDLLRN